jgi:HopA1 effector protein family
MPRATADLREIVEAVEVQANGRFSLSYDNFDAPVAGGVTAMTSLLASTLYWRLYCRPSHGRAMPVGDTRASRVFVDRLSQANCGTGSWEPGWVVRAVEDHGTLAVSKGGDDMTLWAQPKQFRPLHGTVAIGTVGRLRLAKELREMLPGYYTVLGDADQPADGNGSRGDTLRFYWHLTAEIAPGWINQLTRRFNTVGVAFHAKVLSDPGAYLRADAGVLYIALADAAAAMTIIPGLHRAVSASLRPTTPMFTKRLARGIAVAEDPGDGRSFGQHRCQLVAEGLVRAFQDGQTATEDVTAAVAARFAEDGLLITRPWLNPGSRQQYGWPAQRTSTKRTDGL